ncbi:unnamed protein product [Musa textilis]
MKGTHRQGRSGRSAYAQALRQLQGQPASVEWPTCMWALHPQATDRVAREHLPIGEGDARNDARPHRGTDPLRALHPQG